MKKAIPMLFTPVFNSRCYMCFSVIIDIKHPTIMDKDSLKRTQGGINNIFAICGVCRMPDKAAET